MVTSRHLPERRPIDITFAPQGRHRNLPVEVVTRSDLLGRIADQELASLQRAEFHQLIVCTSGVGNHKVDFESVPLGAGTILRIHPGQVQQFVPGSDLSALMVIWPVSSHQEDPEGHRWYPGSTDSTRWQVDDILLASVVGWIDEVKQQQERFVNSPRNIELMHAMLRTLMLRLAIALPQSDPGVSLLPAPYLELRELIETRLYERPGVAELARELGYSSRTLDRACKQVSEQTAKQVLDERVALEVRRLLTHSDRPIARIAADFGISDPSNFSKFVKRHLDELPRQIREAVASPVEN